MKQKFILIFLYFCSLEFAFGLELYINGGKENNKNFAVLNIIHDKPFLCQETLNRNSEVESILCKFDQKLASRVSSSNTLFFVIEPELQKKGFYLRITPKKKIKLFNTAFNINAPYPIPLETNIESKRWQIVGYEDTLPFLEDKPSEGLNFPITFNDIIGYPSIGVLDVRMSPISNNTGSADKDSFLKIQSLIANKSYREALIAIDEMSSLFPNTIFKRDILYLKIIALDGLASEENYEDIITLAKTWQNAYPTDIHISEILYIIAKTYAKMDFFEEASYYYRRLFDEYKGDQFELLARLDYGKNLYQRGERKLVLNLYQSVLNETQNLDIASLASIALGEYYRETDKEEAQKYLQSVLQANPTFFEKDVPTYYNMLKQWTEKGIYTVPAQIAEILFLSLDEDYPEYRDILKDVAIWYDKSENLPKAHHYYQLLLQNPTDGKEEKEIKELDDILLLKLDEDDVEKRLEHYDYVLKNYEGKEEAKKALEKKIETLFQEKHYEEVFALRNELEENNPLLLGAVAALVRDSLSENNCKSAAYYGNLYAEKIPLEENEKFDLLQCLYQNQQYIPAQKIAQEALQKITKAENKEKWLYYLGWVEYQLQNYPKAALASRDALNLLSKEEYNDVAWVLFMALNHEKRKEEAFNLLPILEEKLKNNEKMIEIYRIALLNALEKKDDTAIKIYAQKIIDLQNKYQHYEYSPWVELSLVESLNREAKFQESLQLLLSAQTHISKPQEKIQIYYLQGYLNHKLNKIPEAIQAYTECEAVDIQSPWKNLCIDAKKLLESETTEQNNE